MFFERGLSQTKLGKRVLHGMPTPKLQKRSSISQEIKNDPRIYVNGEYTAILKRHAVETHVNVWDTIGDAIRHNSFQ
jgi:hypothetical protein